MKLKTIGFLLLMAVTATAKPHHKHHANPIRDDPANKEYFVKDADGEWEEGGDEACNIRHSADYYDLEEQPGNVSYEAFMHDNPDLEIESQGSVCDPAAGEDAPFDDLVIFQKAGTYRVVEGDVLFPNTFANETQAKAFIQNRVNGATIEWEESDDK